MRVGLEILARRLAWALTPPGARGQVQLWHATFVDTAALPAPPAVVRIVDLGAYHGAFSIAAARALVRRGQPGIFELVEPVFTGDATAAVEAIRALPGCHAALRAVAVAATSVEARTVFVPRAHYGLGASFYREHRDVQVGDDFVRVPTLGLGALLDEYAGTGIDVLKVNVEGAEGEAFNGVDGGQLRRCRQVVIEYHGHAMPEQRAATDFAYVNHLFALADFTATQTHAYGPVVRYVRRD